MAQQCILAASQYGRHPPTPAGNSAGAKHVDATMHLVQSALLQATDDRPPPHPQLQKLPTPEDAVLTPGEPLHPPLKNVSG